MVAEQIRQTEQRAAAARSELPQTRLALLDPSVR